MDYSKLKPFTVSISRSDIFPLFRTSSKNFAATRILSMVRIECHASFLEQLGSLETERKLEGSEFQGAIDLSPRPPGTATASNLSRGMSEYIAFKSSPILLLPIDRFGDPT